MDKNDILYECFQQCLLWLEMATKFEHVLSRGNGEGPNSFYVESKEYNWSLHFFVDKDGGPLKLRFEVFEDYWKVEDFVLVYGNKWKLHADHHPIASEVFWMVDFVLPVKEVKWYFSDHIGVRLCFKVVKETLLKEMCNYIERYNHRWSIGQKNICWFAFPRKF